MDVFLNTLFSFFGFLAAIALIGFSILILAHQAQSRKPELEIETLNDKWDDWKWAIKGLNLDKKELKKELKKQEKADKAQEQKDKNVLYVLDFDGDIYASQVEKLRQEVTAILQVARPQKDEVLCRVSSPGGTVPDYGLAAAQLKRIRDRNITLNVAVDRVSASGGYLMSCVANHIMASPFALVGSIGVIAQVPNFHRLLKKWDVDYKEYTAGEFKRTVSLLGEIQPKGEQKFLEQLEDTHVYFKNFVNQHRPNLDISRVATGEYWYGAQALDLGLVDSIQTSDEYLLNQAQKGTLIHQIKYLGKSSWTEKLSQGLQNSIDGLLLRWLKRLWHS